MTILNGYNDVNDGYGHLSIVVYEMHPHVAIIREFAGYNVDSLSSDSDNDDEYLKGLDPKDWKSHDMYAILGLRKLRYLANVEDIRKAYRHKLLTHHPDKRRFKGEAVKDESHDYFSCITIAYEILGNPSKRHAYDSVDPVANDDYVPTLREVKNNFYDPLHKFFFSKAREEYDTTRDFSFLDEESKEKGEDREERRAIDKCNRAERARRRAEELHTIHQVVVMARQRDPRLLAAQQAAREAKEAKRQARLDAIRQRQEAEEELARQEAAAVAAARAASAERRRIEGEQQRKEREQLRAEAKRERNRLRHLLDVRHNNFLDKASDDPDAHRVHVLSSMDLLCQRLSNLQLKSLNDRLEAAATAHDAWSTFNSEAECVRKELQAPVLQTKAKSDSTTAASQSSSNCKWTSEMNQTLIKAVNLLPAGTPKRWEAIAAYVNQHCGDVSVSGKEALKRAKGLKQDDESLRREANTKAFDSFSSAVKDTDAVKNVTITNQIEAEADRPWALNEQKALEQALRRCPAQANAEGGQDRWQKIADMIGTRTRRECMLRCKLLADQVKAKKAALATAGVTPSTASKAAAGKKPNSLKSTS